MIADAELPGIVKTAMAIELDVSFKQHRAKAHGRRLIQAEVQQLFSITLPFQFRRDADGAHGQHGDGPPIVALDHRLHEHVLSDQLSVLLHYEVQLRDEGGVVPQHMHHIVLAAAGSVYVPEGFPDQVFGFPPVFFFL